MKRQELKRFIRFGITGVINTAVDSVAYLVLLYVGSGIYLAQTLGYCAGTLNSYIINRSWTFKTEKRFLSMELVKFAASNLVTLLLSLVAIYFLQQLIPAEIWLWGQNISKVVIKLPVAVLTIGVNFLLSRLWVFKTV